MAFLLSGGAALVYQLAWQRYLFRVLGIDTDSVTVIVTAFMAGLGFGSLAGGAVSVRLGKRSLVGAFAVAEALLAIVGVSFAFLLLGIESRLASSTPFLRTAASLLALLPPTLLMGATLPLLSQYVSLSSVGNDRAVSRLYAINTLGSAAACLLVVFCLFGTLGLRGSTFFAGACNMSAAGLALLELRRQAAPAGKP